TLAVEGLDRTGTDVIVRLERPDDDIRTQVLQRRRPSWTIPPPQARPTFPWSYVPIGVEHVLLGLDHLLIVLALVWLTAGHVGPLLGSLTAFTLGHSLTLIGITLLPALQPPSASVEAWIALTLLAAALEMDRHDPRKGPAEGQRSHLFWGAFAVGLLHGLGFAGALAQLGWPDEARVWAVLLFNLGVEVGQIGVVAGLLVLARGLGGWVPEPWIKLPVYLTGALGAFWTFQRALAIVMG
ncbi:MAG: HupE/UreJ family protein, partial [Myxococcota bacterium]